MGAQVGAGRPRGGKNLTGKAKVAERALLNKSRTYKTALEWAMAQINDPVVDIEIKSRLAIAAMPYQHPKIESIPANGGKKKQRDVAAEDAQKSATPFAAPGAPRLVAG